MLSFSMFVALLPITVCSEPICSSRCPAGAGHAGGGLLDGRVGSERHDRAASAGRLLRPPLQAEAGAVIALPVLRHRLTLRGC